MILQMCLTQMSLTGASTCFSIWETEVDEAAWMKHLNAVVANGSELHDTPLTYPGFLSYCQQDLR